MGVINAVTEVGELAGRKLVDDNGQIIRPARATIGLRHLHFHVECRRRVADDGGGRGQGDDGRQREARGAGRRGDRDGHHRVQRQAPAARADPAHPRTAARHDPRFPAAPTAATPRRSSRSPNCIAPAKPQPRFGSNYTLPIIYAGNKDAAAAGDRSRSTNGFDLTSRRQPAPGAGAGEPRSGPRRDSRHVPRARHGPRSRATTSS